MDNNFNLICMRFQENLINIFNNENQIPFLLKYYLFKQIWEKIEQKKFENDYEIKASQKEKKNLTAQVSIPDEFFQENNSEETTKEGEK